MATHQYTKTIIANKIKTEMKQELNNCVCGKKLMLSRGDNFVSIKCGTAGCWMYYREDVSVEDAISEYNMGLKELRHNVNHIDHSVEKKQKLKPCPFCDGAAAIGDRIGKDGTVYPIVQCSKCLAEIGGDSKAAAIKAWNTRPDHSGESAEIDWEQRRWDVHWGANKIAIKVILMAQFEVSKSDPDLVAQIDWKKMAEASMEFANEMSQSIVDSYQLKQQSNG